MPFDVVIYARVRFLSIPRRILRYLSRDGDIHTDGDPCSHTTTRRT